MLHEPKYLTKFCLPYDVKIKLDYVAWNDWLHHTLKNEYIYMVKKFGKKIDIYSIKIIFLRQ